MLQFGGVDDGAKGFQGRAEPARASESSDASFVIITLKALADFSPGLLQPWVIVIGKEVFATVKGLRRRSGNRKPSQLLQSCGESLATFLFPGFQSKPWAGTRQRFQRYSAPSKPNQRNSQNFPNAFSVSGLLT
jgi:hypothetical protein